MQSRLASSSCRCGARLLLQSSSASAPTSFMFSTLAASRSTGLPTRRLLSPTLRQLNTRQYSFRSTPARFSTASTPPPPPSSSSTPPSTPPPTSEQLHHAARSKAYQDARKAQSAERNRSLLLYTTATIVLVTAASYLAVPLYRVFCSATGYAGTPTTDKSRFGAERLQPVPGVDKRVKVSFNADSSDALPWSFEPQQKEVRVLPGETALAFYTATNHSDEDIIGIATYNVTPNNVAPYFAKVECFCFEEQRLLAREEVDLPVFFFIDRDFVDDPLMKDVTEVTLSYTFFRARRDSYGNLVPSDGPLAVENSVQA